MPYENVGSDAAIINIEATNEKKMNTCMNRHCRTYLMCVSLHESLINGHWHTLARENQPSTNKTKPQCKW